MAAIKNGPSLILIPRSLSADMASGCSLAVQPEGVQVGGFGRNMPQPNLAAAHAPASKERPGRTGKSKAGRERSGCKRRHSLDQSDGGPWASWNRSPNHPILVILSYPPRSLPSHSLPLWSGRARDTAKARARARPRVASPIRRGFGSGSHVVQDVGHLWGQLYSNLQVR